MVEDKRTTLERKDEKGMNSEQHIKIVIVQLMFITTILLVKTSIGQTRIDLDKQATPVLAPGYNVTFDTINGVRRINAYTDQMMLEPPTPPQTSAPCFTMRKDSPLHFPRPGTMALEAGWLWICAPVTVQDGEYRWKKIALQSP